MSERKLYALITCPISDNPKQKVIQVSFNRDELEEMADYLNRFKYYPAKAWVTEVSEHIIEYYWPR